MAKINIIYGSTTGNTEEAANLIAAELGGTAINVTETSPADFEADLLVLGSSTWGVGELQDDWFDGLASLDSANLEGKQIALFGEGDQNGFSDSFIDAVGILYEKVTACGAVVIGKWDTENYEYNSSTAEIDGSFVGLALDEDNQPELTRERIKEWCVQLKTEALALSSN
jgi:flavodoxin I